MAAVKIIAIMMLLNLNPGAVVVVEAVLNPVDFLALQSIRSSLSDLPGSTFFSSWDFTSDPCSTFSGVSCSGDRLVSLSLGSPLAGSPGLSGRLHPSLSRLNSLSSLSLLPGRVSGPLPSPLPPNLRLLLLSHNLLFGPLPLTLPRRLQTLDLSFNLLSGPIPPALPSPTLSNLFLNHNRLTGPIPGSVSSSPLIRLDLARNNLSGDIPALPPTLTYLSLSSNRLSGRIDRAVARLKSLSYLDLSRNRLGGSIPRAVFSFSTISRVYMQRNLFEGPVRVYGGSSEALEVVDLSYNRLSGTVPAGLAEAERIYLNCNRFEGVVPGRYGERVRRGEIRVLYLQRNFLTGMDVEVVPESVSLCLNYNCLVPPAGMVCPVRSGRWKSRPAKECKEWKKGMEGKFYDRMLT